MGFFRQEYRSGLPFPSLGDLPDSPVSPSLQADSLPAEPSGKPTSPPDPPKRREWPLVWTGQNKKGIQAAREWGERHWELSVINSQCYFSLPEKTWIQKAWMTCRQEEYSWPKINKLASSLCLGQVYFRHIFMNGSCLSHTLHTQTAVHLVQ